MQLQISIRRAKGKEEEKKIEEEKEEHRAQLWRKSIEFLFMNF